MNPSFSFMAAGTPKPGLAHLPVVESAIEGVVVAGALGLGWWLYGVARRRMKELRASEERYRELR